MQRIVAVTIVALLAGTALAGCASNDGGDGGRGGGTPMATVTATPLAPRVGETVTFEASAAEGDTVSWAFGDGNTGSGRRVTHAYETPGQYIVALNVTTAAGRTATNDASLTYLTVTLAQVELANISEETPPVAVAASSAQVIQVGGNVRFDASGSGAWIPNPDFDPEDPVQNPGHNAPFVTSAEDATFAWDFGDGETGEGVTVAHNFTTAGLFPVKLTVTSASGSASSYVISVRVLPQQPPASGVRNPGVFTIATIAEPESLDPAYNYESSGGHIIAHVYETLYTYQRDRADVLVPLLAAAMPTYNADRTELTVPLKQNVKFHNGDTMDAHDVKFSIDRAMIMDDPDGPAWILATSLAGGADYHGSDGSLEKRQAYLAAGGVTVVDDHTVRFKLDYPDPAFLFKIAFSVAAIVSKEGVCANAEPDFVDCLPPPGETRHPWMDTHEVGSGPYRLEAWIPGQQLILTRFEEYHGEKPAIQKVVRQKVEDINTRLLMLFSGQADDVYIPVDHDRDVIGKPNVRIVEHPSWTVSFIGFNQKFCGGPGASGFEQCMTANGADAPKGADGRPDPLFFSDINMRKAWTYAFDYETYYEDILNRHGRMLNGPLPEGIFGYDASIPQPKRDMTKAREFYQMTNHSNGFTITIFYNSGNTVREKTANLLATNLRELGPNVNVNVQALDAATAFLPKQRAGALPVFYLGWLPDYAFPDNYVVTFAHSQSGVFSKRIGYSNPALDAKLDELVRETDEQELRQGWSEAVRTLNDDFAFLWLGQSSNFHVERDWVQGYYYNPMHPGQPNAGDITALRKG
ncbi:MAG TPA: ABC transporter substrate-binding protein [Candidatus Thermoplasmatota archaeon]|nr:ABC transporter substrate-binding protein [Candidatus Thermoplasmatota archaeon]